MLLVRIQGRPTHLIGSTVTHPAAEDAGHTLAVTVWTGQHRQVIVTLRGELDITSAPALREQLRSLLRPGASELVVDLSAVRDADASGLAVLVGSQRRAVLLGGGLRLAAPQPAVVRILAATGLSRHLDLYPTVMAAIAGRCQAASASGLTIGLAIAARALPAQTLAEFAADSG